MYKKGLCMKIVGMITWLVTALAAIAIGLMPLGYRVFEMPWFSSNPAALNIVHYVIGIFGILSLVMLVTSCFGGGCGSCHSHSAAHRDHNHKM